MRVGGVARYFFTITNEHDLSAALAFTQERNLPFFVLGGGSNTIIPDEGFSGVVAKMEMKGIRFEEEDENVVVAIAEAGEDWDGLVAATVERGLYGLENLSAIPGTVGAAPIQNIGAYGIEAADVIEWVEVFDPATMHTRRMTPRECAFGYRDSFFKTDEGKKLIVLRVAFRLSRDGKLFMEYDDVQKYFVDYDLTPNLAMLRRAIIAIRASKLPDMHTAGSFFKNPIISKEQARALKERYPDAPCHSIDDGVKVSAAWLIEHVGGWKGYREGAVGVYEHHALVLINYGTGTSAELFSLAEKIVDSIKSKTGITLEQEVCVA